MKSTEDALMGLAHLLRERQHIVAQKKKEDKMKCTFFPSTPSEFTLSITAKADKKTGGCTMSFRSSTISKRKVAEAYLEDMLRTLKSEYLQRASIIA